MRLFSKRIFETAQPLLRLTCPVPFHISSHILSLHVAPKSGYGLRERCKLLYSVVQGGTPARDAFWYTSSCKYTSVTQ